MSSYIIPAKTRIGHVHLKVSDLQRSLDFYCGLLGFELMMRFGEEAAFISAGGYHHHIGLNTWYSKGKGPAPIAAAGLFHTAIVYPERRDLAIALRRLADADYPLVLGLPPGLKVASGPKPLMTPLSGSEPLARFVGASDHGVSEALYLDDPDHNGVELYWDRPRDQWPTDAAGKLAMYTRRLDLEALLREAE